jgi:hypothetical protein
MAARSIKNTAVSGDKGNGGFGDFTFSVFLAGGVTCGTRKFGFATLIQGVFLGVALGVLFPDFFGIS